MDNDKDEVRKWIMLTGACELDSEEHRKLIKAKVRLTKGAQWADAPLALLQQGWVISSVLLKKKIPNSWLLILYRIFQQMVEPSENEVMFKIMEIFRWIWKNQ